MAYKILLIESDAGMADETRAPLADAGFEVLLAEGSEAGLEALQQNRPDLAMVDAVLPADDALDLCQELKGGSQGSIPVIVLGTEDTEASPDFTDPNGLGCDEYLRRPIEGDELVALCNKLIESVESLDLSSEEFDSALEDLDAELDEQILADDSPPSAPESEEEDDPSEDDEADVLSFRSTGDVSDSFRESLEALEEEESRFAATEEKSKAAETAEAAGLDMNTILEQLENSEPEPVPALSEPSAATPEGPGVDPFAQAEEIGHHIDDLFGADPKTPIDAAEPSIPAKPVADAPDLLGIDDDLVVWEGSSADATKSSTPPAPQPPTEIPPPSSTDFDFPPQSEESLPGATPFTAHGMDDNVEFAVDGMDEPSSGSGMGLKVAAAVVLLAAAGGAAFWLLPSEPGAPIEASGSVTAQELSPSATPSSAATAPSGAPDPMELAVFDLGAADAAVREEMFAGLIPANADGSGSPIAASDAPSANSAPSKSASSAAKPRESRKATAPPATAATPVKVAASRPEPAAPTPVPAPSSAQPSATRSVSKPAGETTPKPTPKPAPQREPRPVRIAEAQPPVVAPEPPQSVPTAADRYASLADSLSAAAANSGNSDSRVVYSEDLTVPVTLQPIPGSDFVAPKLIHRPDPKFPVDLVRASSGTSVVLRVNIDASGKVVRVVVQEGERDGVLTGKAIAAVLGSRYEPATIAEGAVKAWVLETFTF